MVYTSPETLRPIRFVGNALADLRGFPAEARRRAGLQLWYVQRGGRPDDFRPMPSIGAGVMEIRIRSASGAYRVIIASSGSEAVHVLHCFAKQSQRTARHDIELARRRLSMARGGR